MRLLVEGCEYDKDLLTEILGEGIAHDALDGNGKFRFVGYLWNDEKNEAVFFLPKVIVYKPDDDESDDSDNGKRGKVFGVINPNDLAELNLNDISKDSKTPSETVSREQKEFLLQRKEFLLEFAIRIYRALAVFRKTNTDKSVSLEASSKHSVRGAKHVFDTRLDVILALLEFYRRNRDFVVFTAKRCHSGFNRVNWTKTVAKKTPVFQSDDEPVYMQVENREKRVDFEEELLVIFHSILHYVAKTWGFAVTFDLNYEPIAGAQFERYLGGYGAARLRAIKYRYFSDKLLELWELCYLFFKFSRSDSRSATPQEYLYAKKFDVVFEAMIDELIGDSLDGELDGLKKLKEQADGKRADHIYFDQSLLGDLSGIPNAQARNVCCIGDSKYYGIGNEVGEDSIAKQFTYAKNVIQWNIGHNLKPENESRFKTKNESRFPMLRDDVTEGYDIVPNFFISAVPGVGNDGIEGECAFDKDKLFGKEGFSARKEQPSFSRQFENRLFDRDTLHIAHFDVNFFFVIALYGRNNAAAKAEWKRKVHKAIRESFSDILKKRYSFFELMLLDGKTDAIAKDYIKCHFADLIGKVFSLEAGGPRKWLLALELASLAETSGGLYDLFRATNSPFTPELFLFQAKATPAQ